MVFEAYLAAWVLGGAVLGQSWEPWDAGLASAFGEAVNTVCVLAMMATGGALLRRRELI